MGITCIRKQAEGAPLYSLSCWWQQFLGNQRLQEKNDYLPPCYHMQVRQPQETAFRVSSGFHIKPAEQVKS